MIQKHPWIHFLSCIFAEVLTGMTTTCDATEVKVTLDATEVSHLDTSHLHVGIDPNNPDCHGAQTGNIITFVFGLGKCDPAVVVSGNL